LQSGAEKLQQDIETAKTSLQNAREKASTLGDLVAIRVYFDWLLIT
jgi:hypothetical protein